VAAGLKQLFGNDAVPSPEAANVPPADASGPVAAAAREPEFAPIVPPPAVRRTRIVVLGVALALFGWLGYLAFQQWMLYTDPLARAITAIPVKPPTNEAAGQLERAPEPVRAAPAPVVVPRAPQQQVPRATPQPAPAPRVAPAPSSAPRVTHTLREEPKPVPAAPVSEPVVLKVPAAAPCTEAVAALGLCGTAAATSKGEGK